MTQFTKPHPVTLADPHKDVIPHSYVVITRTTSCANCGATCTQSDLYAKTNLRYTPARKYATNLRPLQKPEYNLPVQINPTPLTTIPFCHACPDPTAPLRDLPYPPASVPEIIGAASETASQSEKKRKETTTDDLMKGII
jgi:hypothetical protein